MHICRPERPGRPEREERREGEGEKRRDDGKEERCVE
jgi:hypothetical protein